MHHVAEKILSLRDFQKAGKWKDKLQELGMLGCQWLPVWCLAGPGKREVCIRGSKSLSLRVNEGSGGHACSLGFCGVSEDGRKNQQSFPLFPPFPSTLPFTDINVA